METSVLCSKCEADAFGLKSRAEAEAPTRDDACGQKSQENVANGIAPAQELTHTSSSDHNLGNTVLDDTILDSTRTVIESITDSTMPNEVRVKLATGSEFRGYSVVKPIKVASAEADLWEARRISDGVRAVIKLFHRTVQQESAVSASLAKVSLKEVVERYEHGAWEDGRYYEVLEFIAHGSLRDLIQSTTPSEEFQRNVVHELANAIAALHEVNILHRDIKPTNVLVRSISPLDLVLADFGIASLTDVELLETDSKRTPAYSAPEAMTGIVARASDWWSFGVIILELLTGRRPFTGIKDRDINFQLVTRGIAVPEALKPEWRPLVCGLLTRDHARRWGKEQVYSWLAGKRDIPVYYETGDSKKYPIQPNHKQFQFEETRYDDVMSLSAALACSWDKAVTLMRRKLISKWVANDCLNHSLASTLKSIEDDKQLDNEGQLAVSLLAMNASMPLTFRSALLTVEWLYTHVDVGISLLESTVPDWLFKLRNDEWLHELREKRAKLLAHLTTSGAVFDLVLVNKLIFATESAILKRGEEVRKNYAHSDIPSLNSALLKHPLGLADAILILGASTAQFVTQKEAFDKRIRELNAKNVKQVGSKVNEPRPPLEVRGAYRLRWKGKESGPFQWTVIQRMLAESQIGLMHEIQLQSKWILLRTFLELHQTSKASGDSADVRNQSTKRNR